MKIGSFEPKPISTTPGAERKAGAATQAAARPGEAGGAEASAQVALSPAASLLVRSGEDSTFDTAKVERIAAAIREGRYQINAEAIADKLIVNAEELLGRKVG